MLSETDYTTTCLEEFIVILAGISIQQLKLIHLRTGQNTASLTHILKLELLDMVNVKKEYTAGPPAVPTQRKQYFEGRMIP